MIQSEGPPITSYDHGFYPADLRPPRHFGYVWNGIFGLCWAILGCGLRGNVRLGLIWINLPACWSCCCLMGLEWSWNVPKWSLLSLIHWVKLSPWDTHSDDPNPCRGTPSLPHGFPEALLSFRKPWRTWAKVAKRPAKNIKNAFQFRQANRKDFSWRQLPFQTAMHIGAMRQKQP